MKANVVILIPLTKEGRFAKALIQGLTARQMAEPGSGFLIEVESGYYNAK